MAAYRCTDCGISYPDSRACRVCDGKTSLISDGYDRDWEEKVQLALAEARDDGSVRRLVIFRTVALLDLGFSLAQIEQLALRPDIHHDAETLLKKGASHDFVVHELKEG